MDTGNQGIAVLGRLASSGYTPYPPTHPIPLVLPDHTHYIVLEMLTLTEMHSREVDPEDTVVDGG